MADTTRRIFCRTCGKEISIHEAKAYNLGRRTVYECFECQKKGMTEAEQFHIGVCIKTRKEKKK